MGFLGQGSTYTWEEANTKPTDYVRDHGILQFLEIYNAMKNRTRDTLYYGDEIEYIVVHLDPEQHHATLSLRGHEILTELEEEEKEYLKHKDTAQPPNSLWRPEYAVYMVEGTPGAPYNGIKDLIKLETSMKQRRRQVVTHLKENEYICTLANFPLLGDSNSGLPFTHPHYHPGGPVARSLFTPDEIISPHIRFPTLTRNIRERRNSKVDINVPLYKDEHTRHDPIPHPQPAQPTAWPSPEPKPYNIHMDSMAFGMGCCCLQCTFQCCNINEARHFFDQLHVLSPIMVSNSGAVNDLCGIQLALSAATPIFRGYLADTDVRWNVISASVDDRTEEERGLKPLKNEKFVINKSRYDSIDCYISLDKRLKPEYNDIDLVYDKEYYQQLVDKGVDHLLARHIAHLFIRNPLVIYKDRLMIDDKDNSDHFENIQSTNWQTMRFKPPPPHSPIGWRVEFRPMDIQLTDFENAAYSVFIVLLTRVITAFDLNLYIPLSMVDANMKTAHHRDAVLNDKFYFRKDIRGEDSGKDEYQLMTVNEIMNGNESTGFVGLIPLTKIYLDTVNLDKQIKTQLHKYLNFLALRAAGKLMTAAHWIRKFVREHPDYKHDSVVTPKINYDLVSTCIKIGLDEIHPEELLGPK